MVNRDQMLTVYSWFYVRKRGEIQIFFFWNSRFEEGHIGILISQMGNECLFNVSCLRVYISYV